MTYGELINTLEYLVQEGENNGLSDDEIIGEIEQDIQELLDKMD